MLEFEFGVVRLVVLRWLCDKKNVIKMQCSLFDRVEHRGAVMEHRRRRSTPTKSDERLSVVVVAVPPPLRRNETAL